MESFEDLKVNAWLQHQPTYNPAIVKSIPKVNNKRKRDDKSRHIRGPNRRRNPLHETTMNSSAEPSTRPKGGVKPPARQHQPRRMSRWKNIPPTQLVDGGADNTGYSGALQRAYITLLPRRGTTPNSSVQSRSSSPVQTIHDLTIADTPITFEANSKIVQPPQAIAQLYKRILDVSDRFDLLPKSLKLTQC